ncbi:MAG: aspartate kinase [Holosporales bacterium]|jgi:aspartate kinase|nr:aspartate kinase [Holosporales bacterium]
MKLCVLKFGGSSVATTSRIKHVSEIIASYVFNGKRVVVITSAMQGVTNQLIELTKAFNNSSLNREYDAVVSSGELVAAGLLAMRLNSIGIKAKSLNAWQIPIKIKGEFSDAFIERVNKDKILEEIEQGIVPIITGFQGISESGDVYTIGRGGSDATACAVASVMNADECCIYTDVDGVYTADPRIVLKARRLKEVSYDEMLELARCGARVLQAKSIDIAKQYEVSLKVLSSFTTQGETIIAKKTDYLSNREIAGIAYNTNMAMATGNVETDDLPNIERVSADTFIFPKSCELKESAAIVDNNIGIVSIVGKGTKSNPEMFREEIISYIKGRSMQIKYVYEKDLSLSLVAPFQQTEITANLIHSYLFE